MDPKLPLPGAALLATTSLFVAWWVFSVDTQPNVQVSSPVASPVSGGAALPAEEPRAVRGPRARQERRERRSRRELPMLGAGAVPLEPREAELYRDDRAVVRNEFRLERQTELAERLEQHALDAGWDAETTRVVSDVLVATTERISAALDRVDRGEVSWDQVRDEMRDFRLEQARDVREILGDQAFDAWVDDMGFERFAGEGPPVHGRLGRGSR